MKLLTRDHRAKFGALEVIEALRESGVPITLAQAEGAYQRLGQNARVSWLRRTAQRSIGRLPQ